MLYISKNKSCRFLLPHKDWTKCMRYYLLGMYAHMHGQRDTQKIFSAGLKYSILPLSASFSLQFFWLYITTENCCFKISCSDFSCCTSYVWQNIRIFHVLTAQKFFNRNIKYLICRYCHTYVSWLCFIIFKENLLGLHLFKCKVLC